MRPSLGIDFGTSNTRVAVRLPGQAPIPLPIGEDGVTEYMPSVAAFPRNRERPILIGEEAQRASGTAFIARSVKRCLGCHGMACSAEPRRLTDWCNGKGAIRVPSCLRPAISSALARATASISEMSSREERLPT